MTKTGKNIFWYALIAVTLCAVIFGALRNSSDRKDIRKVVESIDKKLPQTTHYSYLDMVLEGVDILGDTLRYRYVIVPMHSAVSDVLGSGELQSALSLGMKSSFQNDYRTTDVMKLLHQKQMVYLNVFDDSEGKRLFDILIPPSTYNPWVEELARQ